MRSLTKVQVLKNLKPHPMLLLSRKEWKTVRPPPKSLVITKSLRILGRKKIIRCLKFKYLNKICLSANQHPRKRRIFYNLWIKTSR